MSPRILLLCALLAAPALAADGKPLYAKNCQSCHGAKGEGNAKIAAMMKVELRHLGSPEVQKKSDAELKKISMTGIGKMKPVKGLTDAQAADIVAFIRTLKK